jgi:hypothetical protein
MLATTGPQGAAPGSAERATPPAGLTPGRQFRFSSQLTGCSPSYIVHVNVHDSPLSDRRLSIHFSLDFIGFPYILVE